jgi:hypothetical protein
LSSAAAGQCCHHPQVALRQVMPRWCWALARSCPPLLVSVRPRVAVCVWCVCTSTAAKRGGMGLLSPLATPSAYECTGRVPLPAPLAAEVTRYLQAVRHSWYCRLPLPAGCRCSHSCCDTVSDKRECSARQVPCSNNHRAAAAAHITLGIAHMPWFQSVLSGTSAE